MLPRRDRRCGTSLVVQWLRHHAPTTGGLSSIPGQGSHTPQPKRPRMPQRRLKILCASVKTLCSQKKREPRDGLAPGNPTQKGPGRKPLFLRKGTVNTTAATPGQRSVGKSDGTGWGETCPADIKMNSEITTMEGWAPLQIRQTNETKFRHRLKGT